MTTTPTLREAAQQALDDLDDYIARIEGNDRGACASINTIRAALAEQAAEQAPTTVHRAAVDHAHELLKRMQYHRDGDFFVNVNRVGAEALHTSTIATIVHAALVCVAPAAEQAEPVAPVACRVCGGSGRCEQYTSAAAPRVTVKCFSCGGTGREKASTMPAGCTSPDGCRAHGCHGACLPHEPPAPARQEPVSRTIDLWFFRELSDEQRMSLFRMAGLPADEIRSDATQRQCLRHILGAAPARQEWQPIETAPRGSGEDGPMDTRDPAYIEPPTLLLWTQDGPRVGYYDWYYHPGYGRGADPHESPWRCAEGGQAYGPTHWMPLPAAPITAAPAEGGAA
jgi:hypothetical protein